MFSWLPPPLPKIPPTSVAIRIRSVGLNGCGPSGWPIAAYSPGISNGLVRAFLMYALIPAT